MFADLQKTAPYLYVTQQNISQLVGEKISEISRLIRFNAPPENPRVGGSIPPLATMKSTI
jgi:hypothetical protein